MYSDVEDGHVDCLRTIFCLVPFTVTVMRTTAVTWDHYKISTVVLVIINVNKLIYSMVQDIL